MKTSQNNLLDKLMQDLGIEDAIEVLEYALPRVFERQKKIQQHLQAKQWEEASAYAHQTISSIRLYGSDELERLLRKIKERNESERIELQGQLSREFTDVLQAIEQWLVVHR